MSKRGKKRFWTVLVAAALVATLMISSVVAEEGPFVGSDKLSVESVEDEEIVEEVLAEEDEEILVDERMEATEEVAETEEVVETEEELPTGEVTEEADDAASEPTEGGSEEEPEIQTMSVEGEIKPFAAGDVSLLDASGDEVGTYDTVSDALNAAEEGYTIQLNADVSERVTVDKTVTLDLNGCIFSSADISGSPTTVAVSSGTLTIIDSSGDNSGTIAGGHANNGGGVELTGEGAVVNFYSGTISGNSATKVDKDVGGGGVNFEKQGTFNMYGGVITGNTSAGSGGGVFVTANSTFNMYGGTITENTASYNGGGVYVNSGSFNMTGGTIEGNTAYQDSGDSNGGGVYINGGTFIMGNDAKISGNSAKDHGGGVNVASGSSFTMNGGTITGNKLTSSGDTYGAGVAVRGLSNTVSSTTFTMNGGTISDNNTGDGANSNVYGGGVYSDYSTVTLSSSGAISGNGAKYGAGVCAYTGSVTTLNGSTISDNTATTYGGGIYIYSSGSVSISGSTEISGNSATNAGGGVYCEGTATMSDGKITGNSVTGMSNLSGGGVTLNNSGSTFTMSGGEISGNTADLSGGGVYVANGTFNLTNGSIEGNKVNSGNYAGAGVCLSGSGAHLVMAGGSISENESAGSAGGVQVFNGSSFEMTMGTISKNTAATNAGGVEVDASGTFTMSGGTISENTATSGNGGGVYVASNGTFTMNDGTLDANQAPTTGNTSNGKGGGVYVPANATFIMNGGTISNSVAGGNGGGVYVEGAFTLAGGTITGNQGDHGGGVDVYTTSASCTVLGGSVTGNTAVGSSEEDRGGGVSNIYLAGTGASRRYITLGASLSGSSQIGVKVELGVNPPTESVPVQFTTSESGTGTEYYAASVSYFFSDEGYGVRANSDNAYLEFYVSFEETYLTDLTDESGTLYTSATKSNYAQILSGADAWEALSEDEQNAINADLAEASGDPNLDYPTLLAQAQAIADATGFEEAYLMADGEGGDLYTAATYSNYEQILSGEDAWEALSDEAKAQINADLTNANNGEELTYPMLLAQAKALAEDLGFEEAYLMKDGDGNLYTEATPDNYEQILTGESAWDALTPEEQAQINADLTAVNGGEELTYPMLLAQAKALGFEETYLTGDDGDLYTEATKENYEQILAGESDWDALSDEAKAQINADLTNANNGVELTYPMLLEQARAMQEAAGFEEAYLMADGEGDLYTEATKENYEQILAGESDWDALSDEAKAQINADLTAANNGEELTYPMLLAQAKALADDLGFEEAYLMNDGDGNLYTEATPDNYEQILAGESAWYALTEEEQAQINADLTAANDGEELTYPMLLAQAKALGFEETYLTGDDGDLYTEATLENYQQILAGEDAWNALSDEAKAQINDDLTAANGGVPLTYEDLLAQAKAYEVAADFVDEYVRGSDGYTYKEATPANYLQILAGEDEWNAMSQAERDAVNAILAANGSPTYEELLAQAKAIAAATDEDLSGGDSVKTGDSNTLYLYILLAMAAAAAVVGVAVSRKRPV